MIRPNNRKPNTIGHDSLNSVAWPLGTFTRAKTIHMILQGGESAASYTCTLD